jgi:hypothetical protein
LGLWLFGRWSFGPNGAYTLPVLVLPGLWWAYRKSSPATVGLYVLVLAWWVVLQPFAWRLDSNPVYFIGCVGGLLLVLAESHRAGSPFAIPYRFFGILLSGGVLVPLSNYEFNTAMLRGTSVAAGVAQTLAIAGLAAVTFVLVAVLRLRQTTDALSLREEVIALGRRQWLPVGLVGLMTFLSLWEAASHGIGNEFDQRTKLALTPTVLANAAMIPCALWLMRVGLREDRGQPFAAGVLYFLFWIVLRYIDLFGDAGGMLGAAVMFFLCGAGLFGVALFWRQRKEVPHG